MSEKSETSENVKPEPPPDPILQFFAYEHLPPHLQAISKPFCELAKWIAADLPRNPERTVALRKLLESKDAAVRAKLMKLPDAGDSPLAPSLGRS